VDCRSEGVGKGEKEKWSGFLLDLPKLCLSSAPNRIRKSKSQCSAGGNKLQKGEGSRILELV